MKNIEIRELSTNTTFIPKEELFTLTPIQVIIYSVIAKLIANNIKIKQALIAAETNTSKGTISKELTKIKAAGLFDGTNLYTKIDNQPFQIYFENGLPYILNSENEKINFTKIIFDYSLIKTEKITKDEKTTLLKLTQFYYNEENTQHLEGVSKQIEVPVETLKKHLKDLRENNFLSYYTNNKGKKTNERTGLVFNFISFFSDEVEDTAENYEDWINSLSDEEKKDYEEELDWQMKYEFEKFELDEYLDYEDNDTLYEYIDYEEPATKTITKEAAPIKEEVKPVETKKTTKVYKKPEVYFSEYNEDPYYDELCNEMIEKNNITDLVKINKIKHFLGVKWPVEQIKNDKSKMFLNQMLENYTKRLVP